MKEKDFDWCNDSGYSDVFDNNLCECTAPQVNDGMCFCGRPINNTMMHDNKLIAEFMWKHSIVVDVSDTKYHESWDWLMPVHKKCMFTPEFSGDDQFRTPLIDAVIDADIDRLYKAVVEFIKKYNEKE